MPLPPAVGVKLYSGVFPFRMYFLPKKSAIHIKCSYSQDTTQGFRGVFFISKILDKLFYR